MVSGRIQKENPKCILSQCCELDPVVSSLTAVYFPPGLTAGINIVPQFQAWSSRPVGTSASQALVCIRTI